jgi:uncharacterized protein (TIGR03437 family)
MQLSGTVVRVNGSVVPILSASPDRVDFLCPNAVPDTTLEVAVQTLSAVTQPVHTISRQMAPGIFSIDGTGTGQGTILHNGASKMVMLPNYRYPSQPAQAGDSIAIYATGIDPTADVSVQISGSEVTPQFVIPVSGLVGVYQLSVFVPAGAVPRNAVISFTEKTPNGLAASSNEVKIATEGTPR